MHDIEFSWFTKDEKKNEQKSINKYYNAAAPISLTDLAWHHILVVRVVCHNDPTNCADGTLVLSRINHARLV